MAQPNNPPPAPANNDLVTMYKAVADDLRKEVTALNARIDLERKRADEALEKIDRTRQDLADHKAAHAKALAAETSRANLAEGRLTMMTAERDDHKNRADKAENTVKDLKKKVEDLKHDLEGSGVSESKKTTRESIPKAIAGIAAATSIACVGMAALVGMMLFSLYKVAHDWHFLGGIAAALCLGACVYLGTRLGPLETANNVLNTLNTSGGHH